MLADEGLDLGAFRRVGKLATGTRRALAIPLGEPAVEAGADGSVEIRFELPAGAYATAVLREVIKPAEDFPA